MARISGGRSLQCELLPPQREMSETRLYEVGLRFTVDDRLRPPRKALHGALETVRIVVVEASSVEEAEAEAQVDQIRMALEHEADCPVLQIDLLSPTPSDQ